MGDKDKNAPSHAAGSVQGVQVRVMEEYLVDCMLGATDEDRYLHTGLLAGKDKTRQPKQT
jgi:hypothetical protein